MSLKRIWAERAANAQREPEWGPSPLKDFRPRSFEEIRASLVEKLTQRLPGATDAIKDPTSVFGQLVDAIAASDADQWKQVEAIANVWERQKK